MKGKDVARLDGEKRERNGFEEVGKAGFESEFADGLFDGDFPKVSGGDVNKMLRVLEEAGKFWGEVGVGSKPPDEDLSIKKVGFIGHKTIGLVADWEH